MPRTRDARATMLTNATRRIRSKRAMLVVPLPFDTPEFMFSDRI